MLQKCRKTSTQGPERTSSVNQHVVESQVPSSPRFRAQPWNDGLFKRKRCRALRTGAVEHADKSHCQQQRKLRRSVKCQSTERGENGQNQQESLTSNPVGCESNCGGS